MKERPIIMQAESVRAILEGHKTQTRRVIKPQPNQRPLRATHPNNGRMCWYEAWFDEPDVLYCPYGQPGDRLWVREAWWQHGGGTVSQEGEYRFIPDNYPGAQVAYAADHKYAPATTYYYEGWAKRPSIFMPRWASRITLEITHVRVERLQDIREQDIRAEGVATTCVYYGDRCNSSRCPEHERGYHTGVGEDFRRLWNEINAKRGYSWDSNPFVWALEFKQVQP